ncbi:MAG: AtpZ/AtpI family protein [Candidatus Magasanikbacteria bacterium]|nr:AtpZ/AtpI family protein [Candidatus Magasanikbacteria bacterium]
MPDLSQKNSLPPRTGGDRAYYMFALRIVGDFGASIAVPIVILALLGQWLDNRQGTEPRYLIIGFVLAAILSAKLIYRKAKIYGQEYQKMSDSKSAGKK